MIEQHHYVLTWDSEAGWFVNEPMAKEAFQGVAIDLIPAPFKNEQEARAFVDKIKEARINEALAATGERLAEQLSLAAEWLNEMPLYPPEV
jgi:hypothetical protein